MGIYEVSQRDLGLNPHTDIIFLGNNVSLIKLKFSVVMLIYSRYSAALKTAELYQHCTNYLV